MASCEPHRSFALVAIADTSEDVAELAQCCCADGLGDIGVSVWWCEGEEADWVLVEDQLVASEDTGGGLWCYDDVVRQVPGVAPAFVELLFISGQPMADPKGIESIGKKASS